MTLKDFLLKCWSMPKAMQPNTIYVFEDADNAESWMRDKYYGENNNDSEILFVWHTFFTPDYIIKEEWLKKEVDHFCAPEQDVLVVCLEEDKEIIE